MEELIKLIVDFLALRDAAQNGTFSAFAMAIGFAVTFFVGVLAFGVVSYADKHPGPTSDRLLMGFLGFAVLTLTIAEVWGWRYQKRLAADRATRS